MFADIEFLNAAERDQIDKASYQPAYLQLANLLKQKIAAGVYRPGDQLPSESELRVQYTISQMTVRRAIGLLQEQGVVDTSQGKGSFVKPLKIEMFSFQLDVLQRVFADKKRTEIKLLEVDLVYPDPDTMKKLAVAADDRVVYLRRLILRDTRPVLLHRETLIYDPCRPLVESEMAVTSLDGLFSGNGHTDFKKGEMTLFTTTVSEEESGLLQIPANSAVFRFEHVFYDFNDTAVTFGQFLCGSDAITFYTKVGLW